MGGVCALAAKSPKTRAGRAGALGAAFGTTGVPRPPTPVVRVLLGRRLEFFLRSQRVSNRRFREATGWAPRVPDAADGIPRALAASRGPEGR